ncbi:conjugal transfer protein TraY [Legionella busanensis]|uniref:Relaxosome protein TraY n=1 Tax=Legionella busanensis TaxID=190655 RepID=A0A378KDW4_9GAMM|nr:TraY domain-containing protein [Legionella busanensis]STX81721.1 conjugal transfer protein TraY [Legionella busanensis]
MKSENNKKYPKVYISFQLSEKANQLLTESCKRSGRKKIPEAALRLEDHLNRFRSISELNQTILNSNIEEVKEMEIQDVCTSNP